MMASKLVERTDVQELLDRVSGVNAPGADARLKKITRRILSDLYSTIEDFEVSSEEFWRLLGFLQEGAREFGLIAPGLGFDHFLDLRMDDADQKSGIKGGTPRTIEGPLYVPGAPISRGFARLDDGGDKGETLIMHGRVLDSTGKPIAGAVVDVWLANTAGNYSYFDSSQSAYNNRRRIETDADGRYKFRGIIPSGYAVPPGGATEHLLAAIGRHGKRPAHIHFFVSAAKRRHLTTQVNIAGDPLLYEDFAQATREGLIPEIIRRQDADAIRAQGLEAPYSEIEFDFVLLDATMKSQTDMHARPRVPAIS
jgi:catechol 1,2-dioxygenase